MNLTDILPQDAIKVGLEGENKGEIIEELVNLLESDEKAFDSEGVLQAVMEREKIMSTGIGNGIAIPHGKSEHVSDLVAAMGIRSSGAAFDSLDGEPVFIFFLLVSPPDTSGPHIRALARISRLLKNTEFRKTLISAQTAKEVREIIAKEEAKYSVPSF